MNEVIEFDNLNNARTKIKIRHNVIGYSLLINLIIMSVFAKGLVPELIGAVALVILFICSFNIKLSKENKLKMCRVNNAIFAYALILLMFFIFQIIINQFDFWQLIAWRGTTRSTFALLLVWFCLRKYYSLGIGIHTVLPLLIIMNICQIIYIYTDVEAFNLFQASWNYLGAVDIVVFPFVFRFGNKVGKFSKIAFCCLFVFVIVAMGSRSVLFVSILLFLGLAVLERNKKFKRLFLVSISVFVTIVVVLFLSNNPSIIRALTVFGEGHLDHTREALIGYAKADFYNKSFIGRLFGDGNTNVSQLVDFPVHNFFWEIMLAYGYIGCILWFGFYSIILIFILFSRNQYRWYLCLFGVCAVLMNYFQPFITNGFLYQFLFFFGGCELYLSTQKISYKGVLYKV